MIHKCPEKVTMKSKTIHSTSHVESSMFLNNLKENKIKSRKI